MEHGVLMLHSMVNELAITPSLGKLKVKDLRLEMIDAFYQTQLKAKVGVRTVRYIHSLLHAGPEKAVAGIRWKENNLIVCRILLPKS